MPPRYTPENWWRHYRSYWLGLGFPWNAEIEGEYLDANTSFSPDAPIPPAPPLLSSLTENATEHCAWVQRRASEQAVTTLKLLGFNVSRDVLRQFLYRLAFGNDPLAVDLAAIASTLDEVKRTTDPQLLGALAFPLPAPPARGPAVERELGGVPVTVWPIHEPDASMELEKSPVLIWNCEVIRILRVRIAHSRLVAMRTQFLRLSRAKALPSTQVFREQLTSMAQGTVKAGGPIHAAALERLIGSAAARSSEWWRDQMLWYLKRADSVLEPRGSYLSKDAPPKQLFIWHEFDYWLRIALKDLPTHADRNRAIARTLAALAGPSLYHPPDLDQFASNVVERWRTRKAARATEFSRSFLRSSITPFT